MKKESSRINYQGNKTGFQYSKIQSAEDAFKFAKQFYFDDIDLIDTFAAHKYLL